MFSNTANDIVNSHISILIEILNILILIQSYLLHINELGNVRENVEKKQSERL